MAVKFSNNAATTLSAGISSGATSFQVASASGFPSLGGGDYMYLTIDSEVVKVTATSGTTFTCDATSSSHSSGDNVELRVTAELLNDFAEDSEALALSGGQMTGNITFSGSQTVDGRDLSADGSKLDGIEASATADQSNAEIRAAVEAASDSNVFTDADHSKLNAIEANATADQSATEIKTAYESNSDTNAFTDADHSKLDGIEASATADQSNAEIRAAVEAASDSNVFTDADHSKLNAIEASADVTDATNVASAGALMKSGGTMTGSAQGSTDTDTSNTGSVTLNFSTNQNFVLTLTGNVTLANPTTETVGQSGFITFIQDGTGSRTVSLGTDYETAGGAGLTLTSTASATDIVPYVVVASGRILLGAPQLAFA